MPDGSAAHYTPEMRVYCVQTEIVWEDKRANHQKVRDLLHRTRPAPRSLVLLPEMFDTGFSMNVGGIADADGISATFLSSLAHELGAYILAGIVTSAPDGRGRNTALLVGPDGQEIGRYQKIHPFTFGGESSHFEPGREILTIPLEGFNLAPFVCYDLRFPEVFRIAMRRGANLFAVIANWPASREHHWLTLLQARAIENQAYVAGVNRCGKDNTLSYSGRSIIVDPRGRIVADAGNEEGMIRAELDLDGLTGYRRDFPAIQDMRADLLGMD